MATSVATSTPGKLSFAKIAAMAPPHKIAKSISVDPKLAELRPSPAVIFSTSRSTSSKPAAHSVSKQSPPVDEIHKADAVTAIAADLEELKVTEGQKQVEPAISDSSAPSIHKGTEDVFSHLSKFSIKPASSDSKSLTSEHTFNLEEKESLRPDDSASVQAIDDEEPFFIPPMAARPDPQRMAEAADPAIHPAARQQAPVTGSAPAFNMPPLSNPLRFGEMLPPMPPSFGPTVSVPEPLTQHRANIPTMAQYQSGAVDPDPKLVEAMSTARDRFFLLQLEEKFLGFLQHSKNQFLDLPLQNSYERLLVHRLADYYTVSRYNNRDNTAIRLCRPMSIRPLPPPLTEFSQAPAGKDQNAPGSAAVKIMRRTAIAGTKLSQDGSTAASSSVPSKATSDAGAETTSDEEVSSPIDPVSAKKMTRDEKEAHYNAARARIFRDLPDATGTKPLAADKSANMSRSSSSSGRKKTHRQKAPKDDSFEARSAFTVGAGPTQLPYAHLNQWNGALAGNMTPYGPQLHAGAPLHTNTSALTSYTQPDAGSHFPGMGFTGNYAIQCVPQEGWPNPQSPQPCAHYGPVHQSGHGYPPYGAPPGNQYSAMSPPFMPAAQPWPQAQFQQGFPGMQAPMLQHGAPQGSWSNVQAQAYSPGHPAQGQTGFPGNYQQRPSFNPQTRSFVPAGSMRPSMPSTQNRPGYPLNSAPPMNSVYSAMERLEIGPRDPPTHHRPTQDSLRDKWGTPAHLPKKPPPSQVPSSFEAENTPIAPQHSFPSRGGNTMGRANPSAGNK